MADTEILNKLNSDLSKEKETMHQRNNEEQAMMAWEMMDDSMIGNMGEEIQHYNESKFEDAEDDDFDFFVQRLKLWEIVLGGQISLIMSYRCRTKMKMKIQ